MWGIIATWRMALEGVTESASALAAGKPVAPAVVDAVAAVEDFTTSMSPSLAEEVTPQNDGSVLIDGSANIREINKAFNWHLPEDEARTMNGMILEALEEIPAAGTRVRIEQYDIDILDVQDNMIKQVKVLPVKPLRESIAE